MSSDSLLDQVGSNIQEKSAMIWNVADNPDGPFTHYFYKYVAFESSESRAERISMLTARQKQRQRNCLEENSDAV